MLGGGQQHAAPPPVRANASSSLTQEQLARIEQNRQAALKRKAEREKSSDSAAVRKTVSSASFYGTSSTKAVERISSMAVKPISSSMAVKPISSSVAVKPISSIAVQMMQQQASWLGQENHQVNYDVFERTSYQKVDNKRAEHIIDKDALKMTSSLVDTTSISIAPCSRSLQHQFPQFSQCIP